MAEILALDRALFFWVNGPDHPAWLDHMMRFATDVRVGRVVLAVLAIWLLARLGRRGVVVALGAALTITASDQLSSHVLKPAIRRARPANELAGVHLLVNRSRSYSFPSSHAANTFAAASYFSRFAPSMALPLFGLAALVSISRVYVGVHYPLDLAGGALLGLGCAALVLRLMEWRGLAPPRRRGGVRRRGRAPPKSHRAPAPSPAEDEPDAGAVPRAEAG
jgi:undecaprenyl-diphosphatase